MKGGKRHVPLRRCVVCGNKTTKSELTRIVTTLEGAVEVDSTGKLPGRGAYVCGDGKCTQTSLKRSRMEYALRRKLTDDDWYRVTASIVTMATPQLETSARSAITLQRARYER